MAAMMKDKVLGCLSFALSYQGKATISYAVAYALLGLVIASIGPTLTHLADQTEADLGDLGFLFPARSAAYLVGSALGGPVFDRFPGHTVLWITMLLTALGTAAVPFCPNVPLLAFCVGFQGFGMGFLDTGGNVSLVWLHGGDKVAPYMQLIHFAFGLGAFLCPLFIELSLELFGSYKYAFWLFAFLYIPSALSIFLLPSPKPPTTDNDNTVRKRKTRDYVLVFIGATILALYVGAEVSMGGFIYSYLVVYLEQSGTDGDYLTSVFWGALAFGRLVAIPVSVYVSARSMLIVNMFFSAVTVIIIWIFTGVIEVVWVCTAVFGFAMSAIYPTVLNMIEKYVNLSGKITSVLVVGGALGEMAVPLVLAVLFAKDDNYGDLMVVLSLDCAINFLLLLVFIWIGRVVLSEGYARLDLSSSRLELRSMNLNEEEIEIDEMARDINHVPLNDDDLEEPVKRKKGKSKWTIE